MGTRLYIGNLSYGTTGEDLRALFAECVSATVILDHATGLSRGYGFVEMPSEAATQKAMAELDGKEVRGRPLEVKEARERSPGGGPRLRGGPGRT